MQIVTLLTEELEGTHWLTGGSPTTLHIATYGHGDKAVAMLQSGQLRLSPYSYMNDPREQKAWLPTITLGPGGVGHASLGAADAAEAAVDGLLRGGARLACFTVDDEPSEGAQDGTYFHRAWARARMWDQYAARHTGAVLVFEQQELTARIDEDRPHHDRESLAVGTVTYRDAELSINLNMEDVEQLGLDDAVEEVQAAKGAFKHLYFEKNNDWASEREYRIVVVQWQLPQAERTKPLEIDFGMSLRAVILGEDFSCVEEVRSLSVRHKDAELLRCKWVRGAPHLFRA